MRTIMLNMMFDENHDIKTYGLTLLALFVEKNARNVQLLFSDMMKLTSVRIVAVCNAS